jgi:predicted MFS family arabinose efflux permease
VLGIGAFLPALENLPLVSLRERLRIVGKPAVFVTLSLTATGLGCGFVVFTYIGTLLRELTGFGGIGVSVMLFLFGIARVAGNALRGYETGRWGYWRSLAMIFATLTLSLFAFSLLAFSLLTPVVDSSLAAASTGVGLVFWRWPGGL